MCSNVSLTNAKQMSIFCKFVFIVTLQVNGTFPSWSHSGQLSKFLFAFLKSITCLKVSSQSTLYYTQGFGTGSSSTMVIHVPLCGCWWPTCPDFLHQHYRENPLLTVTQRMLCAIFSVSNSLPNLSHSFPYCKFPMRRILRPVLCQLGKRSSVFKGV